MDALPHSTHPNIVFSDIGALTKTFYIFSTFLFYIHYDSTFKQFRKWWKFHFHVDFERCISFYIFPNQIESANFITITGEEIRNKIGLTQKYFLLGKWATQTTPASLAITRSAPLILSKSTTIYDIWIMMNYNLQEPYTPNVAITVDKQLFP